jgi:putative FmdB family regulatory protein
MPYYEYECKDCGKEFEALQTFEEHDRHEDHEKHAELACPSCGGHKIEQMMPHGVVAMTAKKS